VSDTNDIQTWRVEQSEEVMDCRIFRVHRDQAHTADGAKQGTFFTLKAPPWVNVIPITTDGELVCVRQFRHGTGRVTLETPAGLGEHDETPETTAARELREETGYSAPRLAMLCQFYANPAFLDNIVTVILAEDVTLTDPTAWDEHEELAVVLVPLAELPAMLARGDFENGVTVAALSRFLLYRHGIVPIQEGTS
jgi:ADP-ribose pyrophosphatase